VDQLANNSSAARLSAQYALKRLAQTNPSPSPFSKDFVGIRIKVESDLHFNGSEFSGKVYIRDAHFSNAALLDNCTFHDSCK
jgi:hypothetical protein